MEFTPNGANVAASQTGVLAGDGSKVEVATNLKTTMTGDLELQVTIINVSNNADHTDICIFPDSGCTAAQSGLHADVHIQYGEFGDRTSALCYYGDVPVALAGVRMETDTPNGNILQNYFEIVKRDATGAQGKPVKLLISKYKNKMGGGEIDSEVDIPADDLLLVLTGDVGFYLKKIVKNSTITLYFPIKGSADSATITKVAANKI